MFRKLAAIVVFLCCFVFGLNTAQTQTITAPDSPIRFAVIGDYGRAGSGAELVSDMVKSWNPDFIITTGDNNYPDGAAETIDENIGQYYHEFIFPYVGEYGDGAEENRFFPSLGNHDWLTDDAQPYFDYFTLPNNERYYDFVAGAVHFFALDANYDEPDGISSTSIQAQWLREKLAESTSAWKIVYMHIPPYSSGQEGSNPIVQWDFEAWGASAVIAGHDHIYERLLFDGFPYFVNGVGGGSLYNFGDILPESMARANRNYGAMMVEADETAITFSYYSVWEGGTLIDQYTIRADAASQ